MSRRPADVADHMAAAALAQRLADDLLRQGKIRDGMFWTRVANEKTADGMALMPIFPNGKTK